jgi:hypothetical protein
MGKIKEKKRKERGKPRRGKKEREKKKEDKQERRGKEEKRKEGKNKEEKKKKRLRKWKGLRKSVLCAFLNKDVEHLNFCRFSRIAIIHLYFRQKIAFVEKNNY